MNAGHGGSAIIFDLDGTLVDSAPDIAASVAHALQLVGHQSPSLAQIRSYIGNGADRLIHRSLTNASDGVADDALFNEARVHFFEHYENHICRHSTIYVDVWATLLELCDRGYRLACVTNKPTRFTEPLLRALGLDRFFPLVLSGDTLDAKKPAPDQLLDVAEYYAIAPQLCTMVGDTATDVLAAKNADMPVIFVTYGYGDIAAIDLHEPLAVVDSMGEIVNALASASSDRVGVRL